ncbi:MAG: BACON domain-containing protein [Prevotella sp.]
MNKIFGFLLFVTGCLFMASCSDDSTDYVSTNTLKVLKAKTYFTAEADTSVIVTDATITEATTEANWLKTEIKGESVQLTTLSNDNLTSRSAQVQLKATNGATATISVTQEGSVFGIESNGDLIIEDASTTATFKFVTNKATTIKTSADWIQATRNPKSLTVSITENTTGKPRIGYVKINSGTLKDSIRIVQASIDDLVGQYTLVYHAEDKGKLTRHTLDVEISKESQDSISLHFGTLFKWGAKYKKGGKTVFRAAETVRKTESPSAKPLYLKSILVSSKGQATFNPSTTIDLVPSEDKVLSFEANGSSELEKVKSFGFAIFNSEKADNKTFVGFYGFYIFPYMVAK